MTRFRKEWRNNITLLALIGFGRPLVAQIVRVDQVSGTDALLIGVSPVNEKIVWVSGVRGTWGRTTDGGEHWTIGTVPGADSLQFRDVHGVDSLTAYLLSIGNGEQSRIYQTTDAGRTWTLQFTNPEPKGFYDCFDFWDPDRGIVIGDAIDGTIAVLTTTNGGKTWERVPPDRLPAANPGEGSFAASGRCLSVGPNGRAWMVMSNPREARLLTTPDYGRTWSISVLPIPTREAVGPTSVSFRDPQHGVILGSSADSVRSAIMTQDGGKTWTAGTPPPLSRGVWGGGYVPGAELAIIVAVGPDGIAISPNEGESWSLIDRENYWSVALFSAKAGWAVGTRGRITRISLREVP